MTRLDHLAELATEYHDASDEAFKARQRLYRAIRIERGRGGAASLRTIADRTGLSFARIAQIVDER